MVAKVVNITLRTLEFVWTILVMSLIGNMIAGAFAGNPSVINYDMFVAAFSLLTLFYTFPVAFNEGFTGHPIIPLVLDILNTIFFFCAGCVMAHDLHVHSCSNQAYLRSNSITNGAHNMQKRCREAQASTAFIWFAFACYAGSIAISAMGSRGGLNMRSGGIRKGGPAMSQV